MINDRSMVDTRKVLTGKDGQLFVTTPDGDKLFLAEVDTFTVNTNVNTVEYQPVGSIVVFAVPTGIKTTLTFTEVLVRDDAMFTELIDDLKNGWVPYWEFQGKMRRRASKHGEIEYQRQVFRNCIPDGTIDLMNLVPGEIIKRNWSFTVNSTPDLQEFLNYGE